MHITTLSASGLKGAGQFTHELAPVNVIVGPNFSGKTARLEAIRLAFLGYLPELGKRPSDTFQLAAGSEMSVSLTLADDTTITRSWKRNGKSVKAEFSTDEGAFGPAVLMDPSVYFGLGDKDRCRYVFGLSDIEAAFTTEKLIADLKAIRFDNPTEDTQKALDRVVGQIDEADYERHDKDQSIQEFIDEQLLKLADQRKLNEQDLKRLAGVSQGLTQLQAKDEVEALYDRTTEIEALQAQANELARQIGEASEAARQQKSRACLLEHTRQQVAQLEEAVGDMTEEKLAALKAELDGFKDTIKELHTHWSEVHANYLSIVNQVETTNKQIITLRRERDELSAKPCCPTCGSKGKKLKDAISDKYDSLISDTDEELAKLKAQLDQARSADTNAGTECERAAKASADNKSGQTAYAKLAEQFKQLASRRADLAKLEASQPVDFQTLETRAAGLRETQGTLTTQLQEARAAHERYVRSQQDEKRMAQAMLEERTAQAMAVVLKAVIKHLEHLKEEMVAYAFQGILETANKVTGGILKSPLEYRDGEIGTICDGGWISYRTFSGVEKALCFAGISLALAGSAPVKVVLLDELGAMDESNQRLFFQAMLDLVKDGVIDQVVACSPMGDFFPSEVNVIRL